MQQEEITNYIIRELGKHHNPNDIALALCEKTNMPWMEAQHLVQQVQSHHHQDIAARQSLAATILSVIFLLIGGAATWVSIWALSQGIVNRASMMGLIFGLAIFLGGIRGLWKWLDKFLDNA